MRRSSADGSAKAGANYLRNSGYKRQHDLIKVGPGQMLLADRAYDSDALRRSLAARGAHANIKPVRHRNPLPAFSDDA